MDAVVNQLIVDFSNGEADLVECERFYRDTLAMLGTFPMLVQYTTIDAPTGTVVLPGNSVGLLAAFYNNYQLGELSIREADWLFPAWRDTTDNSIYNFVRESMGALDLQLVPSPSTSGVVSLLTTYTTNTLPVWLQMPVALFVLHDEYARESNHQNIALATAFRRVAELLTTILAG